MKPVLYQYRGSESVVQPFDGYHPPHAWVPLYNQAALDAVAAERDALLKDAERYRWCVNNNMVLSGGVSAFGWRIAPVGRTEWDRYIDAAIAKAEGDGFRKCEFCGCNTNAKMRACCDAGRDKDKEGGAA